jgi:hypothetical protein
VVRELATIPVVDVDRPRAEQIIRSIHPAIDLLEDIDDVADWPLLVSAEMKTKLHLMETIGNLGLVPPERRVSGPGVSWQMAPFTHVSPAHPSRFSAGGFGVLQIGRAFEVALFETIHHHARFMAATNEPPSWTSQFREIVLDVRAALHDSRGHTAAASGCRAPKASYIRAYAVPEANGLGS